MMNKSASKAPDREGAHDPSALLWIASSI